MDSRSKPVWSFLCLNKLDFNTSLKNEDPQPTENSEVGLMPLHKQNCNKIIKHSYRTHLNTICTPFLYSWELFFFSLTKNMKQRSKITLISKEINYEDCRWDLALCPTCCTCTLAWKGRARSCLRAGLRPLTSSQLCRLWGCIAKLFTELSDQH